MRHKQTSMGRAARWDMHRRALLRAWNDEQTWVSLADWIMGWGLLVIFLAAVVMFLAAWMRLGG